MVHAAETIRGGDKMMKQMTILAMAMLFCAATAQAGLVGYWDFDDGSGQTASDSSGNNYDFQLGTTGGSEAADPAWTTGGKFGNALDFTSSEGDRAYGATSTDLNLNGSWTVSWWQNMETYTWANTMAKADNWNNYLFYNNVESYKFQIQKRSSSHILTPSHTATTGVFEHIIVTYDFTSNHLNAYFNGDHALTDYSPTSSGTPWNQLANDTNTSPQRLGWGINGIIDDKAIWDEALSAGQARSLYTADDAGYAYDIGKMEQIWDAHGSQDSVVIDGTTWYYTDSLPGTFNVGDLYEDGGEDYIALTGTTGMTTIPEPTTLLTVLLGAGLVAMRRKLRG
jgi:hypothetical protein